ncbi:flagellar basal body rod protein FlgB [Larsenimonas rhizosphaerae]|uniref:Flagellar basal body rod protein FlgB n=1 Tax=Larsenimonas rhizosphaerae TaxID=2944682 RepID=A0AA42CWU2_9GAMM|nr:flagellar basal body rod protein FlgB [Larsenimonas rhizosphaerae]MCM2130395.1 flagellar basal body rod protein FlgB [Larsenimonas rhizosphaerae]MCX2523100.1 flagellar basal body rod protein FlgB [Larsenimonas rhizosphaerae]
MLDKLNDSLNYFQQALNLRAQRQEVLSANIANADTPGFQARDFDFSKALEKAVTESSPAGGGGLAMARTSSAHIPGQGAGAMSNQTLAYRIPAQPSLDGNTVDMDMERVNFAENAVHYQSDLQILSSKIKGLKAAMQPER